MAAAAAAHPSACAWCLSFQSQLQADGWGAQPRFFAFMAEYESTDAAATPISPAVGFALCYYAYSTWKGTCLFLEDLYVQESHRACGVGMALMTRCIREASQRDCARVQFQALDWNAPALEFYKKVGASETREWIPIRFEREAIAAFLDKFDNNSKPVTATSK